MDLIFETKDDNSFTIAVTYFDTVLQIKKKIEQKVGYPASGQTLVFNGVILPDDLKVHSSGFQYQSRITLLFSKISLLLSLPSGRVFPLPIDLTDTILQLKHKIQQNTTGVAIPVDRLQVYENGIELSNERTLQDCGLSHFSKVVVRLRPLKVTVEFNGQKIQLEFIESDKVRKLKNKLAYTNVDLPRGGYYFVHNYQVMDDNQSFEWHHVAEGDTITAYPGA